MKDRPMYSPDLLIEGLDQVFSVRTGEFIGYRSNDPTTQENGQINEDNDIPTNQLTLF